MTHHTRTLLCLAAFSALLCFNPHPASARFCGNDPINEVDPLGLAIYAFDGTNNDKDNPEKGRPTNVAILHNIYDSSKGRSYLKGVGTGAQLDHTVGGLTGAGGRWRLETMWNTLVDNFRKGDKEIVITGFSRGAALAREFANMISERGDPLQYKRPIYGTVLVETYPGVVPTQVLLSPERIVGSASSIKFMGLFDTVASFGLPGNDINIGYRMRIPDNVEKVAHATAASEFRSLFPLSSVLRRGTKYSYPSALGTSDDGRFVERKFLGVHSDIGGGYAENLASLAPLLWIIEEAKKAGVKIGELDINKYFNTTPGIIYHESDVPYGDHHTLGRKPFPGNNSRKIYHY